MKSELAAAGVPRPIIRILLRMAEKQSAGETRGLPIGPHPIHLLAECSLGVVDKKLRARGYYFARYVDDFTFSARPRRMQTSRLTSSPNYINIRA